MTVLWGTERLVGTKGFGASVTPLVSGKYAMVWQVPGAGSSGDPKYDQVRAQIFEPDGTPAGSDFLVLGEIGAGFNYTSVTATPDGGFHLVAARQQNGSYFVSDVVGISISPTGQPATMETISATPFFDGAPREARMGDGKVITWVEQDQLQDDVYYGKARFVDSNGSTITEVKLGPEERTSDTYLAVSPNADRVAVVWQARSPYGGNYGAISLNIYSETGAPIGTTIKLTSDILTYKNPIHVDFLDSGRILVTWSELNVLMPGKFSTRSIKGKIFDTNGTALTTDLYLGPAESWGMGSTERLGGIDTEILANGGFVVAWTTSVGVYQQVFDPAGKEVAKNPIGNDFGPGSDVEVLSLPNGGFVAAWAGAGGTRLQAFDATGAKIGQEVQVSQIASATGLQLATLPDGRIVVTYSSAAFGVRSQIVDPRDGLVTGSANAETLYGHDVLNDRIAGYGGNDQLFGLGGDDVLDGGSGMDWMQGGLGNDVYAVSDYGDVVIENAGEGTDIVVTSLYETNVWANVETLVLTGGAVIGRGNDLNNYLYGNSGANHLDGASGADWMFGGAGDDFYYVDNAGDYVGELDGQGFDTLVTKIYETRLMANVEVLRMQDGAVIGRGNDLNNYLFGNSGTNYLDGEAGADQMYGGAGDDFYFVDNAGDYVGESAGQGLDTVVTKIFETRLADNVEVLVMQDGGVIGRGNGLSNNLFGNSGANYLDGGAGFDYMAGFGGDDVYFVDNASDIVVENAGEGFDIVYTSVLDYLKPANVEQLYYTGGGTPVLIG